MFFLRPRICFQIPSIPGAIMVQLRGPPPRSSVSLLTGLAKCTHGSGVILGVHCETFTPPNPILWIPSSPSEIWCPSPEGDRSSQRTGEALAGSVEGGGVGWGQVCRCRWDIPSQGQSKAGVPVSPGGLDWRPFSLRQHSKVEGHPLRKPRFPRTENIAQSAC